MNENQRKQLLMDECYKKGFKDSIRQSIQIIDDFFKERENIDVIDVKKLKEKIEN